MSDIYEIKRILTEDDLSNINSELLNKVDLDTPFEGTGEVVVAQNSGSVKGSGVDISELATISYVDANIGSDSGQETIDVSTWCTEMTETYAKGIVPEEYRDIERLTKALLSATLGEHIYIFRFNESFQNHSYVFINNLDEDLIMYMKIFNDTWEIQVSAREYQQKLVSSTNIKTINNESILGSGNLEISGGSGVNVIEKTLNEEGTGFVETFTEEELNDFINGSILRAKANADANLSYYLTPMHTQQPYEEMYGVVLGGFTDVGTGSMMLVRVISMSGEISAEITTTNGFSSVVEITDVPPTATSGTLEIDQLILLQASDSNYIMFNSEKYYLNDKEHVEGYLSYTHVGVVGENILVKVITITISTRGWVLTTTTLNEEDANASDAMIFNNVVVNSNLTSSEDKANWTKLMNDTLNDQATYPVYINGRRVWFVKVSETDSYGFWINGTEKKTLYNREYPTTSLVFQYYCISNAHSSYRYKFLRGGNIFYASDSYWEPTAIVEWLAQNEGFHILQLNASSNTGWTGKYGDVSLSIYNGQGKTKYDNATHQGGYIDGFSAMLWSSRSSGQKTYFRIISPDEVDEKIAAAIDGALEEDY